MIFENTSKTLKVSVWRLFFIVALSVIGVGLLSTPARAQEKVQERLTGDTRDKGISIERLDTRLPLEEKQQLPLPQQLPCAGNNHTTTAFNNNIFMGGPVVAIAWTPTATLTVSRVEVFTGESTAPIALAIWSDNGGSPSKPLANLGDTGYFNLPTAVNSWQGADLSAPVTVNAATKYWVVFDPSGGEQAPVQNGTGQQYWGSYSGSITSVASSSWFGPFSSNDHAWKFRVFCCMKPPSGMVAWYPFDESLSVLSASELVHLNNGIHQPVIGGPTATPAVVSNGLSFDGVNDYVRSAHQPWLNLGIGNLSIDAWIKTTSTSLQVILDKRQSSPFRGYTLFVNQGFLSLQLADGAGAGFTNYTSTINVANGAWNFIAVTVDRTNPTGIKFYLNGAQMGPSQDPTGRTGLLDNTVPLDIGRRSFSSPVYFKGVIDELEIFNRVLTPVEIRSLSNAGSGGKCKKCW
jgi:hypothetical protein